MNVALLSRVGIVLPFQQALNQTQVFLQIIRVGNGLKSASDHFHCAIANDIAEALIDPQKFAFGGDLSDSNSGIVKGIPKEGLCRIRFRV